MGQSSKNGLGYTGVANTVTTMFIKVVATTKNSPISSKNFNPSLSEGKKKSFVPICHYCNMHGPIHPKCFKYKDTFRMSRIVKSPYKTRTASKLKIDLKNNYVKKIWIKKIRFDLLCSLYFLKGSVY